MSVLAVFKNMFTHTQKYRKFIYQLAHESHVEYVSHCNRFQSPLAPVKAMNFSAPSVYDAAAAYLCV